NMRREIRVDADMLDALAPVQPVTDKINKDVIPQLEARFPGVNVKQQGQARAGGESLAEFLKLLFTAIAIISIILMIHFRSFSQALIILMMIPLAWLGAIWGHGLELLPVSLLSLWGMIALSGVIINDAVVFLAKYNLSLKRGLKVPDAIMEAGKSRFRPILLTTLTTTLGLYPLVLEKSFQALFLQPMAAGLAYGVLFGTIFILIFFPAIIMVLNDIKRWMYHVWTGKRPEPENVEKAVLYQNKEIQD
ncbi:MAG: efflux RND transporter permease subunit, partial [Bacteroidales bacterium]|nr:efflux RND transporter permease subunit [Bacteroidales bacterium]